MINTQAGNQVKSGPSLNENQVIELNLFMLVQFFQIIMD